MTLRDDVGFVMSLIKLELQQRLEIQGHGVKGLSRLIDSMEFDITALSNVVIANMLMENYYRFVETGVKASRIPYTIGSRGRGGTSKYIEGLIKFWQRKGLSPKEAKSAAFATATKHKREGMSTRNAYRFSKDGTRHGFVSDTIDKYEARIFELLQGRLGQTFEIFIETAIQKIVDENTIS